MIAQLPARMSAPAAKILGQTDMMLAFGVVSILVVLVLPLPSFLLDILLALSITFSVLILLTSLLIERPLDFNSFPTVLLIATMLRLALNLASTRLILASGHEGPDAAGHVIEAFGGFIMQGNVVIGIIVFSILVIVNFVVITKGSGRIAEVAARFSLDAMPGKQMAIDADLSAGLIDEKTARERRRSLEEESAFFGAMDGAAKFVRGDAIAGILITFINLVGGLVIGVAQMGVSVSEAVHTYTLLTIGDGLVSQIPALIVSTAAGLLVSKAGVTGRADRALFGQLGAYERGLGMTAGAMIVLGLMPGLPALPFVTLGAGAGGLAYGAWRRRRAAERAAAIPAAGDPQGEEPPISETLALDPLRIELGYGLLVLLGDGKGPRLPDQIKALRRQLASELGFLLPSVRIQDNIHLPADIYVVRLKELEVGRGEIRPAALMVMNPTGGAVDLPGEEGKEPAFGLAATWVSPGLRDEATFRGYTVVDPATVVTTHITEIIKDNLADLLTLAETQKLLKELPEAYQKLLGDIVPSRITAGGIQRILQRLLAERVSIRDLPTILEAISDALAHTQSPLMITEHVRVRLSRQICAAHVGPGGYVPIVSFSPQLEQTFLDALVGDSEERHLALAPSDLQDVMHRIRDVFEDHAMRGELPVLVVAPAIRLHVRALVERFRPSTVVLSQAEIHPKMRIRTLGQL